VWLWLWLRPSPPPPAEAPAAAGKVVRESARGPRVDTPDAKPARRGGRMGGAIPESAKLFDSVVTVELDPDMSVFENGKSAVPDAATAWDKLSGNDLLAALAGLAQSQEDGFAKAWGIVRDEHDPAAKLAVMRAAAAKGGPAAGPILKDGLSALHPQIRYEAVELVEPMQGRDESTRRELLGSAAASTDANVAAAAIGQLANDPRKADLELMFRFLDHPDQKIAASARGTIDFFIDAEFQTAAEASNWWQANAASFDDELSPLE